MDKDCSVVLRRVGTTIQTAGMVRSDLRLHLRRTAQWLRMERDSSTRGDRARWRRRFPHADHRFDSGREYKRRHEFAQYSCACCEFLQRQDRLQFAISRQSASELQLVSSTEFEQQTLVVSELYERRLWRHRRSILLRLAKFHGR